MQDESSTSNKDDKKADNPLKEGVDFYYTPEGNLVFTAEHHIKRGYCCGNGCRHCPYPKNQ